MKSKKYVIINDKLSKPENMLYYNEEQKACINDLRMATIYPDKRSAMLQTTYKNNGCYDYEVVPYDKEVAKYPDLWKPKPVVQ